MKCNECGEKFASNKEAEQHFHAIRYIQTIDKKEWSDPLLAGDTGPLIFLITLPDGCCAGRWEAAQFFARSIATLKRKYRETEFQYVPFDHSEGAVTALLAIEQ